ncbi:MAG: hypothetical protein PQJ50_04960 [Spirochaetales bacterium]|nr:hypothetical protein [Spirochaetales bacterium]
MVLVFVFFIVVLGGGSVLLLTQLRKAWKKADVDQRMDDIQNHEEMYEKISNEDVSDIKRQKKVIDDFLDKTK